jgi:serine/threonine protein kinase
VAKKILHSSKMMLSPVGKSTNFPPEFECDGFYSTKYDIWLMGLLLLQIICKTHISSKTALQIVKGLKEKNPKYTGSIVLSEECENLMGQFLEPNPDNRINATEALRHKWLLN